MGSTTTTTTEERAMTLLGYGANPESVAAACGVDPSRISQLVSDPHFAAQVAELRFQNLAKYNERDSKYDTLEDELLEKLDTLKDLICNPMQVLKALQVLNTAKRRGSSSPEAIINNTQIVNLSMPTIIITKFQTNQNNQVIKAGSQDLVTIPSHRILDQAKQKAKEISDGLRLSSPQGVAG